MQHAIDRSMLMRDDDDDAAYSCFALSIHNAPSLNLMTNEGPSVGRLVGPGDDAAAAAAVHMSPPVNDNNKMITILMGKTRFKLTNERTNESLNVNVVVVVGVLLTPPMFSLFLFFTALHCIIITNDIRFVHLILLLLLLTVPTLLLSPPPPLP